MMNLAAVLVFAAFSGIKSEEANYLPCTCRHDNKYGGIDVVCTALNLTQFPILPHPSNVTTLQFTDNVIHHLKTGDLQQFVNLHNLDLSRNHLADIEKDAFKGLSRLVLLRLDGNHLQSIHEKGYQVFAHLNNLQVLYAGDSGISVSGQQITGLISLQELVVDCHDCVINPNFTQLSSLARLTFVNCAKRHLTNSTFVSVPHLESLHLAYCSIEHIEAGTFEPLKKLSYLDLSWNQNLGIRELTKGSYGLRNSPIKRIDINYVTSVKTNVVPMDRHTFQYFSNTSLIELYADGNVVAYVEKGTFEAMPKTMKLLSSSNSLIGDFKPKNFSGLFSMYSLQTLNFAGTITWDPANRWHDVIFSKTLYCPPHLENANIANRDLSTDFREHIIVPSNVLKRIVVNNNSIRSIIGPIIGADSVNYLDVSSNTLSTLGSNALPRNNSLKFLNFSNNNLGDCFEGDKNGDIFVYASLVETLDISNNRITSLPRLFFKGLIRIKYLNITNNVLFTFELSLNQMTDLQHLDLSNNKLQLLPVDVQKDLDFLKTTVVNLKDNPLACSCQSLQFLQWIKGRHDRIQGLKTMTCRLPNGTQVHLNDIGNTVSQLEKQCSSNVVLIAVTVSSVMCVLIVVGVIAGYRNRWKLRYLYHVGRRGYQVLNEDQDVHYRYDAFVSYADEDRHFVINKLISELEEKSGVKLCIHHRDFLPGAVITENIVTSIQNSRKTLLVLSPDFLKSEWCSYEFNMALVDGISRKQNTVVTVLYKHVEMKSVPKDLAVMLSNNSYLEYNTDLHGGVVFWNNLVESINTTQPLH